MQRLGLCCVFQKAPISFRSTTASSIEHRIRRGENTSDYLSELILSNISSLHAAILFCSAHNIGSFRINSRFFPLYTHPQFGYQLDDLPKRVDLLKYLRKVKSEASRRHIRLTFHPDQFVVLNSPFDDVVEGSIKELEYHGFMARLLGADVITLHGGGGYGHKAQSLLRLQKNFTLLSHNVQERLALENDDKVFTPEDLLPLCHDLNIPLVYDVHHHRCLPDSFTIEEATARALQTWNREPLFHVSSPKEGWTAKNLYRHAEYINPTDIPSCWAPIDPLTIEVEAKAKELAVIKLCSHLRAHGWNIGP
jgi:UV DNA damage endonuclease